MSAPKDVSNIAFVPAGTTLVGGYTSGPVRLLGSAGASVTLVCAGTTVAGTFKLQVTDFGAGDLYPQDAPASGTWIDSGVSQAAAAAGVLRVDLPESCHAKWMRLVFTDSGSAASSFSAALTVRGRSS